MFEKFQQLKEASVRAAKRGADAIKTVSDEVKAATQNTVVSTSSAPPAVLSRTAGASMKTQLMDEFQSLCQYLDNLKVSDREEELSGAETEVIRGSLKRIIFALSMDNERYMAASYRSHEKANPKDVWIMKICKMYATISIFYSFNVLVLVVGGAGPIKNLSARSHDDDPVD